MQELKRTSFADGHYHIVYLNSETGAWAIQPGKDGHIHELVYDPARPPTEERVAYIDETGQEVDPEAVEEMMIQGAMIQSQVIPADPGKEEGEWILQPGGEDLHTHEVTEYVPRRKEKEERKEDVIKECLALWREGISIVQDCKKKAKEAEDFYKGKQWDPAIERELKGLDRAALTINEVATNIDTLIGYQMENRTDIRYLPQEGGDQRVADMLNVISKKVLDSCYFGREETKAFKDACVSGMGVLHAYMDFQKNIQGEIKVERFPWDDIVYGPHEKEDLADCEYEVRSRMMSIAKLKQMFGAKANDIEESYKLFSSRQPASPRPDDIGGTHSDYRYAEKVEDIPMMLEGTLPLVDVQRKQFRLVQCTRKMYKEVTVVFNQSENFFFTAYDWEEKDIEAAAALPGFQVISQLKTRMRITKFCANVVLSDENPADLPMHDFYTMPIYGYRQNGEFWGKVEVAKDPQRELNKRRSQTMDTMNRLGAAIYYTEPETFIDRNEEERFKKNRSRPGSMFKVSDINRRPVLEAGSQVPPMLVELMQMDQANLQRLMNVVVLPGGANESGVMYLERKKGRLTGNQFLFDNLSFAKQKLGKILVALIQRYYPPERLQRLLNSQYGRQKFEIGGQDFKSFSKDEILEMLQNADLLEYDVIVSESSFAPSTRLGVAMALFELMSKGAQIPPELPLEFIDMPDEVRSRISERLGNEQEMQQQTMADTSNAEITKTLIAKGQYTVSPEKAAELGLIPAGGQNLSLAEAPQNGNNIPGEATQDTEYANRLASALAG